MNNKIYRFEIKVNNVYDYLMNGFVSHLNTSNNIISGWIKETKINELKLSFSGMEIKLIESKEYYNNIDKYE